MIEAASEAVQQNTSRLLDWYDGGTNLPLLEPMFHGPIYAVPRSGGWGKVEKEKLNLNPACEACGTTELVEVHHIYPFHLYPELELALKNLLSLCRPHHLIFGHYGDWSAFNPDVVKMVRDYFKRLQKRPYKRIPIRKGSEL